MFMTVTVHDICEQNLTVHWQTVSWSSFLIFIVIAIFLIVVIVFIIIVVDA